MDCPRGCELPKSDDGGGPAGVKERADEGGGPAGVVEGFGANALLKLKPSFPPLFEPCRPPGGVDGGLEENGTVNAFDMVKVCDRRT